MRPTATLAMGFMALVAACGGSSPASDGPLPGAVDGPLPGAVDGPATGSDAPLDTQADAPTGCAPVAGLPDLALEAVATNLSQPVAIAQPPGEQRLFVVEKTGRIQIIEGGVARAVPFLDIHDQISGAGEQGLLGMAFHPAYGENGRFFVYFTDLDDDLRIREYVRSADPSLASTVAREILKIEHPAKNHNGGHVAFGPDGMLYIGTGDGGPQYDALGNGQSLTTRLAKILRIDVNGARPYAAPTDNPYHSMGGAAADIWSVGLRNPWRWSFDRLTGDLWIGDVGQDQWEEVDRAGPGLGGVNFGWGTAEGNNHCPKPPYTGTCTLAGAQTPVTEFSHSVGSAIVGGYVYRGCRMPALQGTYFFGDNGGGFVRSFPATQTAVAFADTKAWPSLAQSNIATFGEDANGELLMCSVGQGQCWRIVPNP